MITADSNVFIYLSDETAPEKRAVAQAVVRELAARRSVVALQVVGEVQNVLRRKFGLPSRTAAQAGYNMLMAFDTFGYSRTAVERALGELSAGRLSYWDALLLASAEEAGCKALLTEDLADGSRFGGVEIVNPFSPSGLTDRARELLEA